MPARTEPGCEAKIIGGTLIFFLLNAALLALASSALAAEPQHIFILPMELETDRGAANGDATLLRLMPAYNWDIHEDWQIVNLDLVLLANAPGGIPGQPGNPEPIPGDRATGLSDWIHASFFNPIRDSGPVIGFGFLAGIPTATDPALGSGKWSIGPALRFAWQSDSWRLAAFGGQRWSFAGKSNRADINQLLIRGTVLYDPPGDWFLVSMPIITANWNAPSDNRWLVPLGGGVGYKFRLGGDGPQWRVSLQAYGNAVRPDGAPTWSARLALTAVIRY